MELSVALAISSVIAAAALSTYATVVGSMYGLRALSAVDTRLQRVSRAFNGDLQEVGGGAVRPWHAVLVQPTPGEADAVLLLTAETASRPCAVEAWEGEHIRVDEMTCALCGVGGADDEYAGRFAVVSKARTGEGAVVSLGRRALGSGCRLSAHGFLDTDDSVAWTDSSLTVVDAKWVFVDTTTHELKAWLLYDASVAPLDTVAPPLAHRPRGTLRDYVVDERVLAGGVYDFQVALGYDVDFNGALFESVDGAGDEWFGNARGEMPVTDWIGDDASEFVSARVAHPNHAVPQVRLRAATFGLVMGAAARGAARAPVQILDGQPLAATGLFFRGTTTRAMFRNTGAGQ